MAMRVVIAQISTTPDADANASRAVKIIERHAGADLIVFPEGSLSGYLPPFGRLDTAAIASAIERVGDAARSASTTALCGAIVHRGGRWVNAAVAVGATTAWYEKTNLAAAERGVLEAGNALPVFDAGGVSIGVQICRELRYPEQWRRLAGRGAQVLVHLNNAHDESGAADMTIWRSMLVSRAAENQRFVVSANAVGPAQRVPSIAIDPAGTVIHESPPDVEDVFEVALDLQRVSDVYLGQIRADLG